MSLKKFAFYFFIIRVINSSQVYAVNQAALRKLPATTSSSVALQHIAINLAEPCVPKMIGAKNQLTVTAQTDATNLAEYTSGPHPSIDKQNALAEKAAQLKLIYPHLSDTELATVLGIKTKTFHLSLVRYLVTNPEIFDGTLTNLESVPSADTLLFEYYALVIAHLHFGEENLSLAKIAAKIGVPRSLLNYYIDRLNLNASTATALRSYTKKPELLPRNRVIEDYKRIGRVVDSANIERRNSKRERLLSKLGINYESPDQMSNPLASPNLEPVHIAKLFWVQVEYLRPLIAYYKYHKLPLSQLANKLGIPIRRMYRILSEVLPTNEASHMVQEFETAPRILTLDRHLAQYVKKVVYTYPHLPRTELSSHFGIGLRQLTDCLDSLGLNKRKIKPDLQPKHFTFRLLRPISQTKFGSFNTVGKK